MAKKKNTMSFKWNYSQDAIVKRLGFDANTEKYFAETLIQYAMPYTPYNPFDRKPYNLHIRGGAKIRATNDSAKITFPNIPYVKHQYFGDDSSWNRATYGTMSGWLDYAWLLHNAEITGKVGAYRRWHSV